jgi:hypothetical protein
MKTLTLPLKDSDIDTRGKRRRVCEMIADEIWHIYKAEDAYKNRIPQNIALGRCGLYARRATDDLFDAALTLGEAFEPF